MVGCSWRRQHEPGHGFPWPFNWQNTHVSPDLCIGLVHTYPDINYLNPQTFSLWICFPFTRIRQTRHAYPQLFKYVLQSENFQIREESGYVWTVESGHFQSGDVIKYFFFGFSLDCELLILVKTEETTKERRTKEEQSRLGSVEFAAKFEHVIGFCT